MTANGAKVIPLLKWRMVGIQVAELNPYLHAYFKHSLQVKYKLSPANSIWFRDDERFTVSQIFCRLMQIGTMQASIKPHLMTLP